MNSLKSILLLMEKFSNFRQKTNKPLGQGIMTLKTQTYVFITKVTLVQIKQTKIQETMF